MQLYFTEKSFKEHTKLMLTYLKEQGYDIPLGKGYEAASRFCGFKSWNVVSAELKKVPVQGAPLVGISTVPVYLYANVLTPASVKAEIHTDDLVFEAEFDAVEYFKDVDFSTLTRLSREGWSGCEEADEIGRYFEDCEGYVKMAFQYLERIRNTSRACGFEVSVDELDVLKYLRAFRYDDYLKLMLADAFGLDALEDANGWVLNGYGVKPELDSSSLDIQWHHVCNGLISPSASSNEKLAWELLGAKMEAEKRFSFAGPEVVKVAPNSGRWE